MKCIKPITKFRGDWRSTYCGPVSNRKPCTHGVYKKFCLKYFNSLDDLKINLQQHLNVVGWGRFTPVISKRYPRCRLRERSLEDFYLDRYHKIMSSTEPSTTCPNALFIFKHSRALTYYGVGDCYDLIAKHSIQPFSLLQLAAAQLCCWKDIHRLYWDDIKILCYNFGKLKLIRSSRGYNYTFNLEDMIVYNYLTQNANHKIEVDLIDNSGGKNILPWCKCMLFIKKRNHLRDECEQPYNINTICNVCNALQSIPVKEHFPFMFQTYFGCVCEKKDVSKNR